MDLGIDVAINIPDVMIYALFTSYNISFGNVKFGEREKGEVSGWVGIGLSNWPVSNSFSAPSGIATRTNFNTYDSDVEMRRHILTDLVHVQVRILDTVIF